MRAPDIRHELKLSDGTPVSIRTIRAEDARIEQSFVRLLSPESKRLRFLSAIRELTPHMLDRFLNPEFPQQMALIATLTKDGAEQEIGVARYVQGPQGGPAEFAVVVADEWQNRGIGSELLERLFEVARSAGMTGIEGIVLQENRGMLRLARELGFDVESCREDPGVFRISKRL